MNDAAIESLYRRIRLMIWRELKVWRNESATKESCFVNRLFIILMIVPIAMSVLIVVAGQFYQVPPWLAVIGIILVIIGYFGLPLSFVVALIRYRKAIITRFKNPFLILIDNSLPVAKSDAKLVRYFISKPIEQLEFLLFQLRAEKESLRARVGSLVGVIEKIGLLPGLVTIFIWLQKIGEEQEPWVYGLIYATPILYLFGMAMNVVLAKLDRVCFMIEYAIDRKNSKAAKREFSS